MQSHFQKTPLALALALLFASPFLRAETQSNATLPVNLTADQLNGQTDNEVKARGNVVVTRGDQTITSDWLDYYVKRNELIEAGDQVHMTEPGQDILAKRLNYYMGLQQGDAKDVAFAFSPQGKSTLRGEGESVKIFGKQHYQINHTWLNTCAPGDKSWYIKASTVNADYSRNVGVARNARVVLGGVPILYTPWIDFPLDGGRKSGLLFPTLKTGSDGLDVTLPYYWNIAPNYDVTFTPRMIGSRGFMLGAEGRYLEPTFSGKLYTEQMPHDKKADRSRFLWKGEHEQTWGKSQFGYEATYVSDDNYFKDFGDRLSQAANVNLLREAWWRYNLGWASAEIKAQRYQTLHDAQNPSDWGNPYASLPQINFYTGYGLPFGLSTNLFSQYTRFTHPVRQDGDRFIVYPTVQWNMERPWGFFRPKFGVNYTEYKLNEFDKNPAHNATRTLPITSVDSGLYFEREMNLFGTGVTQTLEPRLFYVRIPKRNQSDLPNFDSAEKDFNWEQLFSDNQYSGWDRINSANQLTTAVSTGFIDHQSGLERLRVGVGQRFYFSDNDIALNGDEFKRNNKSSDLLLNLSGQLTQDISLSGMLQHNKAESKTQRYNVDLRYHPAPGKALSARYQFGRNELIGDGNIRDTLRQIDIAGQWPITPKLYAVARNSYSLRINKPLEQLAGLEYNAGCWTARMVGQRYVTGINQYKTALMFQLELKDFSSIGNNPLDTLRLAIPGYSKINEK